MRRLRSIHITAVLSGLLIAAPTTAQRYRWDFNLNGGWGMTSAAIDDDEPAFSQGSLGFDNNWQMGGQLGFWFSRQVGMRANFSYMASPFMQGDGVTLFDDVNLWSGTGDVLIRFTEPRSRWSGAEWLPYFAIGLGAHWVNPPGDAYIAADEIDDDLPDQGLEIEGTSGVPIVCRLGACTGPASLGFPGIGGVPVPDTRTLFLKEGTSLAVLIGLGVDIRLAPSFALRVEAGDLVWDAPLDEVQQRENVTNMVRPTSDAGRPIHQFYATLGLNVLFGLDSPPRPVAVVRLAPPPPPPPPAPRPEPRREPPPPVRRAPPRRPAPAPPPPRPTTEDITVCVIDPSVRSGVRMITAQRSLATGDTSMIRRGNVRTANDAEWYVRGAPFEIGSGPNRMVYQISGAARTLSAGNLTLLGTVDGLGVYTDRGSLRPPLGNLAPGTDLERLVAESQSVYNAVDAIERLYVPVRATGCVFHALVKQTQIRKKTP
jgi:hypothetical protein